MMVFQFVFSNFGIGIRSSIKKVMRKHLNNKIQMLFLIHKIIF